MSRIAWLALVTLVSSALPRVVWCQLDPSRLKTGLQFLPPEQYAGIPLAEIPLTGVLPAQVDLSSQFPKPGDQGEQGSCVGWAVAYALRSYQERRDVARGLAGQRELALPALVGSMEELLERVAAAVGALGDGGVHPCDGLDLARVAAEYAVALSVSDVLERGNEGELKDAIRARDEMMEIVSHDLRNLLNAVALGAATLGTIDLSQEAFLARTTIDIIARSAQAMKRLIDDLLDLASIRAGRLSIEAEPQEAAALLGEAVACLEVVAQEKGVTLRAETEGPLPSVRCDRDRVLQVFSNLVGNAVQATSAGGAVVLGARVLHSEVAFSVSDTGGGIPAAELPHIFERYWRGREGMAYKGAGVGLAIAKGLIEAHGGHIWAESREGLGSSFFFTLPVSGA